MLAEDHVPREPFLKLSAARGPECCAQRWIVEQSLELFFEVNGVPRLKQQSCGGSKRGLGRAACIAPEVGLPQHIIRRAVDEDIACAEVVDKDAVIQVIDSKEIMVRRIDVHAIRRIQTERIGTVIQIELRING